MATALTHKYIPRIEQTEENLFMEEYYSSTDTKIYIDDEEQTEIAYINYSVQEQLKPLYGYASRTFDDIAVGNRIVTGTIKVPIKNPESQSSMEDIIARSEQSTLEDYNNNQQDLMNAIDWINGAQNITDTDDNVLIVEDDVTFEYRMKLMKLGYALDYSSSLEVLTQQIKQFQDDHKETDNLDVSGILTVSTKNAIDKALMNTETMSVPSGTSLYTKPTTASSIKLTLDEAQDVYVINKDYEGWIYIMTKDGEEGYIKEGGWA